MSRNPWFALIPYIVLSTVSLASPQSSDSSSGNRPPGREKASVNGDPSLRLALELEADLDPDLLPPPDLSRKPGSQKACDILAEHAKLSQAWFEFKGLQLEAATRHFYPLISSCDPSVQYIAVRALRRLNRESREWDASGLNSALDFKSLLDPDLLPPPGFSQSHIPPTWCDLPVEHTKLSQAWADYKDLHLDAAADRFSALAYSCDPKVQYIAVRAFDKVHRQMSAWWWQMGRYLPPLRWYKIHYPRALWIVGLVVIVFFSLRILVWLVGKYFPRHATIMTPTALTTSDKATAQCDYFASLLQDASIEATRRVAREGYGLQVSATSFLSVPSGTAQTLRQSLPTIKGVDLNTFGKFFFYLYRYFCGWRVESQVAFRPSTLGHGGSVLAHPRIVAFATVRFAWVVKGEALLIDLPAADEYDIDDAAFAMAIRIMGNYPPKGKKKGRNVSDSSNFSDPESYRLFLEGLGALLLYEKEAAKAHPRRRSLEHWMNEALNRLRKSVTQFPADPLPRFSFGIALSMRNQEVYVERLQHVQLKSACLAIGRGLAFRDMLPDANLPDTNDLPQRLRDEDSIAQPFLDLEDAPWPMLDEARRIFKSLDHDYDLKARAIYNLALAYARLGGRKCSVGLKILDPEVLQTCHVFVLEHSADSPGLSKEEAQRKRDAAKAENAALLLQFDILRTSLKVREIKWEILCAKKPVHNQTGPSAIAPNQSPPSSDCLVSPAEKQKFDQALRSFVNLRARFRRNRDKHILAFKADLIADQLTHEGYIYYECAIDRFPIGQNLNAEMKLQKAAERLTAALEIKPNWNPAQIYLALVRRIQSGLADAYIDFLEQKIKENEPGKKDDPIEIKIEMDHAESANPPLPRHEQKRGAVRDLIETVVQAGLQTLTQEMIGVISKSNQPPKSQINDSREMKANAQKSSDLNTWKRQVAERKAQKLQFSKEANNLFSALRGDSRPSADDDSIAPKA